MINNTRKVYNPDPASLSRNAITVTCSRGHELVVVKVHKHRHDMKLVGGGTEELSQSAIQPVCLSQ